MRIGFEGIGKLSAKDNNRFKRYEEKTFASSNWFQKSFKPSLQCGSDSIILNMRDGCRTNSDKDCIVQVKVDSADKKAKKYKTYKFKFSERFSDPNLKNAAEFSKYVIDLNSDKSMEAKLRNAAVKLKEGKVTSSVLRDCNVASEEELKAKIKEYKDNRREYVTMYDLIDDLHEIIESGKYANSNFRVLGEYKIEYNDGKFYTNVIPQKIYLTDETQGMNKITPHFLFGADAIQENRNEKCLEVSGHVEYYEHSVKGQRYAPFEFTIPVDFDDENIGKRRIAGYKKRFSAKKNEIRSINLELRMVAGAKVEQITYDDLTEEQQENVDLGFITLESIQKENGDMKGQFKTGLEFVALGRGSSGGSAETDYRPSEVVDFEPTYTEFADEDEVFDEDDDDDFDIL